jgi:outer membrane receptor protein involved in Fe transport
MLSCAVAAILSGSYAADANAQTAGTSTTATSTRSKASTSPSSAGLDQIIVTAQRRNESVQKVPMTIQALSGATLDRLNIQTFDDLLKYTPNVTFNNNGPGQGNIFMRGLSTGSQGNQSSATIGNFPNVAVYLDDQSLQFPGRNADVYFADMNRVEVLEGPQGTLFGGGAEAGALRYITNKPNLDKYEGKVEGEYGFQDHGAGIGSGNVMVNVPIVQDKLAVRLVAYDDYEGGYIDNVPSEFSRMNSDLGNGYFDIKPNAAGLCPNGQKAGAAGLCSPPNSGPINNYAIAKKDFNPASFAGLRGSVLGKIDEDWNVLIVQSFQDTDTRGSFQEYPIGSNGQTLAPLQTTQFNPSYDRDRYENTAWTVNGKLGDDLKVVYTGSYLDRHISQQVDYINYSRSSGGMYYQCVGGSTGWKGKPYCYSPNGYWHDDASNTHLSNEIRVSTPDDWRLRAIGGVYQEQFRIYDEMNFNYKTIPDCNPTNLAIALAGGPTCVGDVATAPNSTANAPGPRGNNTAFGEDVQRGYDQIAFFGSIDFDIIPNVLTITAGTRYFQYSEFEVGSQYGTDTACMDVADGTCIADDKNINSHHDKKVYHGFKNRFNITWHIDPRTIAYYTYSEGFRPGGFNRAEGLVAKDAMGDPQLNKPNGYAPDSLINNEIGVKTTLLQNRLVLDFSAYYMQWDNTQFLFFNPVDLGNTSFLLNGPNYEVRGMEGQITARPIEGLTLSGSFSANDNSQTSSPCLEDNVPTSPNFGSCITEVKGKVFVNPFGTQGSTPAFAPRFEGSLRGRYDYTILDKYDAFVMADVNYIGNQYNEPATYTSGNGVLIPTTTLLRYLMPSYETYDASVGVEYKKYTMTVFGTNLGNSRASTYTTSSEFIKAETPVRPRVIGVKLSAAF